MDEKYRKVSVMLNREQMELVEKLSVFMCDEADDTEKTPEQFVENAVKTFTNERIEFILTRYGIDARRVTLTEMRQYRREACVDVAARDTVVLPVKDSLENRELVYSRYKWRLSNIGEGRLLGIEYAAFYWRTPTWAVTHYARITGVDPDPEGCVTLSFEKPEALPEFLCPRDPANRLRRPRYTTLAILLEAKSLEELF